MANRKHRAHDEANQPAEEPETEPKIDETTPGGEYIVRGRRVDAFGRPLDDGDDEADDTDQNDETPVTE